MTPGGRVWTVNTAFTTFVPTDSGSMPMGLLKANDCGVPLVAVPS